MTTSSTTRARSSRTALAGCCLQRQSSLTDCVFVTCANLTEVVWTGASARSEESWRRFILENNIPQE